jgi:hypothetical protein
VKLSVLNERLSADVVVGIRLFFPPITLLVDSNTGLVINQLSLDKVSDSKDAIAHYCTLVYVTDDASIAIFEFDKAMFDGLQGYSSRYNIYNIELLLSREANGAPRVTIGKNSGLEPLDSERVIMQPIFDKLVKKYMEKAEYYVHDFKPANSVASKEAKAILDK